MKIDKDGWATMETPDDDVPAAMQNERNAALKKAELIDFAMQEVAASLHSLSNVYPTMDRELITRNAQCILDDSRILTAALAAKDAEISRLNGVVVWIRLVAECVVKEVITLDILDESVTIEDDPMNWHDESVTMTALYDDSGFPIETPKLRAALEAALAKEPTP